MYPNAIAGQVRNAIEIPLHGTYNDVSVAFLVLLLEIPVPDEKETAASRVAFNLTDALEKELNRVQKVADISSKPEVFRQAFRLLCLHVDAAARNREIYMVDPDQPDEKFLITLPFSVSRDVVE